MNSLNYKVIFSVIILLGFFIYGSSLHNSFVIDDHYQVVTNTLINSLVNIPLFFFNSSFNDGGNLVGFYYRPLMVTFFTFLHTFFGLNPFGYHLFSLLLHLANTVLVFLLLRYFLSKFTSLLLALIFMVHPINSEAVLYVSNLQDLSFFFFGVLALLLAQNKSTTRNLIFIAVCLLFSLFSKESGVLFIPIVLLFKYLFNKKGLPLLGLYTIFVVGFYYVLRIFTVGFPQSTSPIGSLGLFERAMHIPSLINFYLKTFLFPNNLSYSWNWIITTFDIQTFIFPLVINLFGIVIVYIVGSDIYKKSLTNFKKLLFFTLWFIVSLSLHLQIIPLDQTVAERWFYLPSIGLLGILGLVATQYAKRSWIKNGIITIAIIIIVIFSVRTHIRTYDWRDEYTLVKHDNAVSKNNFIIESTLANALIQQNKFTEAKIYAQKSYDHFPAPTNLNNLGVIYSKEKNSKKAQELYEQAIAMGDYSVAYENLSVLFMSTSDNQKTEAFIQKAINKFPNNATLWLYYSLVEYKQNKLAEAKFAITKAYVLNKTDMRIVNVYNAIQLNKKINVQFD